MASRNLARTSVRSALAGLGIVIGVLAIVAIGLLGVGLQGAVVAEFGDLGNQVIVTPADDTGEGLTKRDIKDLRRVAGSPVVVPIEVGFAKVSADRRTRTVRVYGTSKPGRLWEIETGSVPEPLRSGALLGKRLADSLDLERGDTITIGGTDRRVRAVLAQSAMLFGPTPDEAIVLSPDSVRGTGYAQAIVLTGGVEEANETAGAIDRELNGRRARVEVTELSDRIESVTRVFDLVGAFLMGIGAISLLVAAVSILNVTLMSAVERREEVGLLRAVGYGKGDVLVIFVAEAGVLGAIGGVTGVALAVLLVIAINELALNGSLALATPRAAQYVILGIAFGVGTGVVSSLYPAWRAASERPVDALRG